jgi:hypothetical protein
LSEQLQPSEESWICALDQIPLEWGKVRVAYLGSAFPVDMLRCPKCGQVFLPEYLALGKMADVECSLEDK